MTVAEYRELLLKFPQEALVVSWSGYHQDYITVKEGEVYQINDSDEGIFSVPRVTVG